MNPVKLLSRGGQDLFFTPSFLPDQIEPVRRVHEIIYPVYVVKLGI